MLLFFFIVIICIVCIVFNYFNCNKTEIILADIQPDTSVLSISPTINLYYINISFQYYFLFIFNIINVVLILQVQIISNLKSFVL